MNKFPKEEPRDPKPSALTQLLDGSPDVSCSPAYAEECIICLLRHPSENVCPRRCSCGGLHMDSEHNLGDLNS